MTESLGEPRLRIAVAALTIGSTGAPILYVLMGFLAPKGFHDFRGSTPVTIAYYIGVAWLASATLTLIVGGATWKWLHRSGKDGILSYSIIAFVSALLIGMVANEGLPSMYLALFAVINALLVRALELIWPRNPET